MGRVASLPVSIGAQVSAAGGVSRTVERAVAMGADAVQVFVDPNRRWPLGPLPLDELGVFGRLLRRKGLPGYVHVPYLANVATAEALLRTRSIEAVSRALHAAGHARLRGVVLHPGSHRGRGFETVRDEVVLALAEAARIAAHPAPILLENAAGAGGMLGATVGEIADLLAGLDAAGVRVGVCLDFAHAHGAGWDLSRPRGVESFAREWRAAKILRRVALVHANDSKAESGSRRDRHANPGEGTIGARGLRLLSAVPELARVPWILEVPGEDHSGPRREDIARLRRIVAPRP